MDEWILNVCSMNRFKWLPRRYKRVDEARMKSNASTVMCRLKVTTQMAFVS
jgi:hypothetical protein